LSGGNNMACPETIRQYFFYNGCFSVDYNLPLEYDVRVNNDKNKGGQKCYEL